MSTNNPIESSNYANNRPLDRKYIHIKVGLLRTARPTPNLCNIIRDAVEKCDHRIGGVEVTIKRGEEQVIPDHFEVTLKRRSDA
jgi:hypothetical protein